MRPFSRTDLLEWFTVWLYQPSPQIYMASNTYVEYFNHTHQLKKTKRLGKLGAGRVQW